MYDSERLVLYQRIMIGLAVLLFLGGIYVAYNAGEAAAGTRYNPSTRQFESDGFEFATFISTFMVFGGYSFSLLIFAELIGLGMAMVDTISDMTYHLRQVERNLEE
jgi:hypothetical protein